MWVVEWVENEEEKEDVIWITVSETKYFQLHQKVVDAQVSGVLFFVFCFLFFVFCFLFFVFCFLFFHPPSSETKRCQRHVQNHSSNS